MNAVTLFKGAALPAFAQKKELSAIAKAAAGSGGQTGKRISIKGGVFRLLQDGKEVAQIEERSIPVVIVNAAPKVGRILYLKKYDPDTAARPDCWSSDGDVPDANVPTPQSASCVDCDQNVKGSGEGDSKKCRYQQQLAVATMFEDTMDDGAMGLTLPALSLFGKEENGKYPLQAYARYLAAQGISPEMLVTQVRFDTKAESPKLFFKPMRWLTEEEYAMAQEIGQSPEALHAIETSFGDAAPAAAPVAIPGKRPGAKKLAAPVEDDEDDDEDDAPAPAPAPKPKTRKVAPAPAPVDDDDEDDEDDAPAPAPAPKPKTRKVAPAPAPVDDDEDDEDEAPAPAPAPKVRKPAAPVANAKPSLAALADSWDDEDED
jgi:hypothetical protein